MLDLADLRARAEGGSIVAQTVLGIALLQGLDVQPDHAEAFRWLSAASSRGAARAITQLGVMYELGLSVPPDPVEARRLYERAAEHGEFLAAIYLARLLASGKCSDVERSDTVRWYRQALSQAADVADCPELEEARAYIASHRG
jgi:TPR repeat protein